MSENLFQHRLFNLKKCLAYLSAFKENLGFFTKENIETIEKLTMGQSGNEHWFEYRKCSITATKAHSYPNDQRGKSWRWCN